jgi:osmotically-inducible protein OsmY
MTMHPFPEPEDEPWRLGPRSGADPRNADISLALAVVEALQDDPRLAGAHIEVDVRDRVVILDGRVRSPEIRTYAGADAWRVTGIRDVCNTLEAPPRR